jgi:hypothetical protein
MCVERPKQILKVPGMIVKGLAVLVLCPFILLFAIIMMAMVAISPEIKPREERRD